ncbi:MAG TPA: hypothetical protein VFH20_04025, partial [Propionibacteriaceae bacterium]|nr:hypothetical protein [Propionibacteriaceae bacterium]
MILNAQQAKASVISNQAAMSSAGICKTTKASTCSDRQAGCDHHGPRYAGHRRVHSYRRDQPG